VTETRVNITNKMTEAVDKALGLNNPSQRHGTAANDHVEGKFDPASDRSDEETLGLASQHGELDGHLEPIRNRTSHQLERTHSGVDVEKAQEAFADLGRELSARSRRMSRQDLLASARRYPKSAVQDVEKALSSSDSSEEHWDLEATLRGDRTADIEAGIKSKLIGVLHASIAPRAGH
jgi:ATP-binding cassette subfamily G (WHITE) protein 2 (SNQ2)